MLPFPSEQSHANHCLLSDLLVVGIMDIGIGSETRFTILATVTATRSPFPRCTSPEMPVPSGTLEWLVLHRGAIRLKTTRGQIALMLLAGGVGGGLHDRVRWICLVAFLLRTGSLLWRWSTTSPGPPSSFLFSLPSFSLEKRNGRPLAAASGEGLDKVWVEGVVDVVDEGSREEVPWRRAFLSVRGMRTLVTALKLFPGVVNSLSLSHLFRLASRCVPTRLSLFLLLFISCSCGTSWKYVLMPMPIWVCARSLAVTFLDFLEPWSLRLVDVEFRFESAGDGGATLSTGGVRIAWWHRDLGA